MKKKKQTVLEWPGPGIQDIKNGGIHRQILLLTKLNFKMEYDLPDERTAMERLC